MMSHPAFTLLTAVFLAAVLSMEENRTPRQRIYVALRVLLSCAIVTVGGSWAMHLIHG
jgi:hypothetical protein